MSEEKQWQGMREIMQDITRLTLTSRVQVAQKVEEQGFAILVDPPRSIGPTHRAEWASTRRQARFK